MAPAAVPLHISYRKGSPLPVGTKSRGIGTRLICQRRGRQRSKRDANKILEGVIRRTINKNKNKNNADSIEKFFARRRRRRQGAS